MRGGRGRGGRGGGGGRAARGVDDLGVPRPGPVTEEAAAYPPNPRLGKAPSGLPTEPQLLVALNRLLSNYWRFHSPFQVNVTSEVHCVQTYTGGLRSAALLSPKAQMEHIIALTGPSYFPQELQQDKLSMAPRVRRQPRVDHRPRVPVTNDDGDGGDQPARDDGALFPEEEDADFGGDDYAHDHYGDEDRDDMEDLAGGDDEAF